MPKETKIVPPLNVEEKDNADPINAESSGREHRQRLLDDIAALRAHVSRLEFAIETPKFGQLRWAPREASGLPRNGERTDPLARYRGIPDVQTKLRCDLYRFAGTRCVKYEEERRLVFEISGAAAGLVTRNDLYAVEILTGDDGRGALGKWSLPMSVDARVILSRYPVDDLNNVKHFLRSCKHHVECYVCRAKQLEELQNLFAGIKNARVSHSIGITRIELAMSGVSDVNSNDVFNVTSYLYYNPAEARPHRLLLDTDEDERPSTDLLKRLSKYFKPFLKRDLNSAFRQVSESQVKFVWRRIAAADDSEDNVTICDGSDDENAGFLSEFLRRDDERPRRGKGKARDEKSSTLHDNVKGRTSLRVEGGKSEGNVAGIQSSANDFTEMDREVESRNEQPAKRTVKPRGVKKLPSDLKKKSEKRIKREDVESRVASATDRVLRRERGERRQAVAEGVQMEDPKGVLLEDNGEENLQENADGKRKRTRRKMANESDVTNRSANFRRAKMRINTIARTDEVSKDKEERTSLASNGDRGRESMCCSTPVSKKLPDKRKFFQDSRISEICDKTETK